MHILLSGAYRLFFPAVGLFAAVAIPLWLLLYMGVDIALPEDSFRWHQHEMLFGYLSGALVGFLLTAIPNWTGRPALKGPLLLAFFSLWVLARIGFFVLPDGGIQIVTTLLFPVILAGLVTREIWLGGNKRNLPVAGLVWLLAISDAIFMFGEIELSKRIGFGIAIVMITLIGGRVTPAFGRNWLRSKASEISIPTFAMIDKLALVATILAVTGWVFFPDQSVTGGLALASAVMVFTRLLRWKGWAVASEPLLLFMHIAYFWVPVSMTLLGFSILGDVVTFEQVVHAIGAGAVGSMTVVIMMRAILGHANRPVAGGVWDVVVLSSVNIGAMFRILVPVFDDVTWLLHLSGTLWAFGFAVFFIRYGRIALMQRL